MSPTYELVKLTTSGNGLVSAVPWIAYATEPTSARPCFAPPNWLKLRNFRYSVCPTRVGSNGTLNTPWSTRTTGSPATCAAGPVPKPLRLRSVRSNVYVPVGVAVSKLNSSPLTHINEPNARLSFGEPDDSEPWLMLRSTASVCTRSSDGPCVGLGIAARDAVNTPMRDGPMIVSGILANVVSSHDAHTSQPPQVLRSKPATAPHTSSAPAS